MNSLSAMAKECKWLWSVFALAGLIAGLGGYTFYVSRAWSYLSDEPAVCLNCHLMSSPYQAWASSSHSPLVTEFTKMEAGRAFTRWQGRDIREATNQEMRSLVCAQCHVEYYFKGPDKQVVFPWDKGITLEQQEEYYDQLEFSDWTHALSKTPMLKAQHPDYELFLLGAHGRRGLSCADCHMPYVSEGGLKFSDHHLMSPLKNISASCQTCHRDDEEKLRQYVYERQDKVLEIRDRLEPELAKAHIMAKAALDNGATDAELAPARKLIRAAHWRWDFGTASHGASFHAPVEIARILAHGLDKALLAQLALKDILRAHGVTKVEMPDLSTKEKAQAYIGLDMPALKAQKKNFLETVAPEWLKTAQANGRL